jgi:hypothetical protein
VATGSGWIATTAGTIGSMIANGPLGIAFWPVTAPATAVAIAADFAPACAAAVDTPPAAPTTSPTSEVSAGSTESMEMDREP